MRKLNDRYAIRFATVEDAPAIMTDLRSFEKKAIEMLNMDPVFQLQKEISESQYCFAGTVDDKVGVIWGIKQPSLLSDKAYLWAITTSLVDEHPFVFIRHSQEFVKIIQQQYAVLEGYVINDNVRSKRWLKFLGFSIGSPIKANNVSVCKFERRA